MRRRRSQLGKCGEKKPKTKLEALREWGELLHGCSRCCEVVDVPNVNLAFNTSAALK